MLAWWIKQSSFQVGLFFTWALAKEAKIQHSKYWISTVTVCREYRHTYFQQSLGVLRTYRRSSLKLLSTLIWEIAQPDAARAHLRADLNLYGEAHSFGRSAFHIDQKVSLDLFEAYSDSKAADSKAEPVRALEAVKASGRLARAVQWKRGSRGLSAPWIQAWIFRQHNRSLSESKVPSATETRPKRTSGYSGQRAKDLSRSQILVAERVTLWKFLVQHWQ